MNRICLLTSVAFCSVAFSTTAFSQTQPEPAPAIEPPAEASVDPEPAQPVEAPAEGANVDDKAEIVVTGSRISRKDYVATSPTITVGQESLARTASVNVEATLNQLPQFVQGQIQSAIGAVANGGRATLNLRGLGETRNLILLNGRRLPLSSAFGVVDINIIAPSILQNVETISGGASAVYGSDAISGVVNFITRKSFEGIQLDSKAGISARGDAATKSVSLLGGLSSADGRGHALTSLSYSDRDVLWGDKRKFFELGVLSSFIAQGTYIPTGGNLPTQAAVNNVFARYGFAPGSVLNTRNLGFNDNGSLFSQIGTQNYQGPTTGLFSTLGGSVRQPVTYQEYIVQPMKRFNAYVQADYALSDDITAYTQILHTKSEVTGQVGFTPTLFVAPLLVPTTNPFLSADLRTILASRPNPTAPFTLNTRFLGFEDRKFIADTDVTQVVVGVKGNLGFKDWRWDVYGLHDRVDLTETQDAALLVSRVQPLLSAADGGASVCAGGLNIFGLANQLNVSEACQDYISTETHDITKTRQSIVEASLTGSLFPLPGGDVRFATTASYRENSFSYDPDPARENSDIIGTLASVPSRGKTNVKEIGIELLAPILRDRPFANRLELNLGYRLSDYNVTGSVHTYRAEGLWSPIKPLLFRGGYERATRAPNIGELYSARQTAQAQIGSPPSAGDPCDTRSSSRTGATAAQIRTLCLATGVPTGLIDSYQYTTVAIATASSGSTDLTPEKATTMTLGAVLTAPWQKPWLSGFSVSLDYYDIKIDQVISQVSANTTLNKCYNLDGSNPSYDPSNIFCSQITRDATGGILFVSTPYLNLGGLRTKGFDLQADWRLDLRETLNLPGGLHINSVVNFLKEYQVKLLPDAAFVDYSGTIDGTQAATTPPTGLPLPKHKIFTNVTYSLGPVTTNVRWRHIPKMKDVTSVTRPTSPAPGVPSYNIFDADIAFDISEKYRFIFGMTNVFDKNPPIVGGVLGQTQPGTYDIIGRSLFAAVTARF